MNELIAIQTALDVPKAQYSEYGGYYYRSCEDILKAVKPFLKDYKCYLKLSDTIENIGERYYIKATAEIVNSEGLRVSCCGLAREALEKKKMDVSQVTGSASSYARKMALGGLFAIDDTKDPDSNEQHKEQEDKEVSTRKDLERLAESKAREANWPEAKKKAIIAGIPKHTDDFLKGIINEKV